jgi:hypothetical protein
MIEINLKPPGRGDGFERVYLLRPKEKNPTLKIIVNPAPCCCVGAT